MILGEVGEHFPVKLDVFLVEGSHELGIGHTFSAGASIYLDVPELAVVRLLVAPVSERITAGMEERFFCLALFGASAVAHSFGLLQDAPSSL
jgi:hypothetical protein